MNRTLEGYDDMMARHWEERVAEETRDEWGLRPMDRAIRNALALLELERGEGYIADPEITARQVAIIDWVERRSGAATAVTLAMLALSAARNDDIPARDWSKRGKEAA